MKITLYMYIHPVSLSMLNNMVILFSDDSLSYHNGQMFSTNNWDNDAGTNYSCAQECKGGWWYNYCYKANLNGLYLGPTNTTPGIGINWFTWKGHSISLKSTEMKIRRA